MKLRTQIITSILVSVLVIAVIGTILFFNYQQLAVASKNEQLANDIVMGSYDLSNLQNDYLLHMSDRNDRARLQWEERYVTLQDDLSNLRITDPVQQETLNSILDSNRQLKVIFSNIVTSTESTGSANGDLTDPELIQIRWNRLGVQTQEMIFDASRLSELVKIDVSRIQQENNQLAVILISVLLLIILMNFLIVDRRILRSLGMLREGTEIIGSGNLDYSIDESSKDEIGELSHAFNRMARNLKSVTASKAELEKEITKREKAEQSAKESLELYQTLSESAKDIIFICDPAGNLYYFNKNGATVFGVSVDDLMGKSLEQVFPPDIAKEQRRQLDIVLTSKRPLFTEINIPLPTINLWLDVQLIPIFTEQGTIKSIMGVARDITSRKKAEEQLIESNERFKNVARATNDIVWDWDLEVNNLWWSDSIYTVFGYQHDDIDQTINSWYTRIHPEDRDQTVNSIHAVIDGGGQSWSGEYRFLRADSSYANIFDRGFIIHNSAGKPVRMIGAMLDITERKRAEETLRESEERFRIIFERSTVGKSLTAPDGRLLQINLAFAEMIGYTIEEMQQLNFARVTYPDDIAESKESIRCLLANEKTRYGMEKRYIHKDGRIIWADVSTTLLKDNTGTPIYFITSIIEITRQKEAEDALKKYSEKLEEIVSERTRELRDVQDQLVKKEKLAILGKLAGGVGHELRNPLGAIKNAAYFLNMALEKPDPDVKDMIEVIDKEVARSEDIISSLLDFARPKTLTLRKESVNTVVNDALKRNPVPEHVTVINNLDETLPEIQVDPDKLLQVFNNIISNSFQAMPDGGIMTITSKQSGPDSVSIAFADTGVGISAENMKKLFEPLFTTKIKGIGLGMVVTKTIVEAHGGHIDIQSKEGKGTTFTVNLPMSGRKDE